MHQIQYFIHDERPDIKVCPLQYTANSDLTSIARYSQHFIHQNTLLYYTTPAAYALE